MGVHLGHGLREDGLASAVTVARGSDAIIPWEAGTAARRCGAAKMAGTAFLATHRVPAELF
jgi:hypothetical protein